MPNETESLDDLKYIVGNMGIEIFLAIAKGAKDFETIKLFSGCSMSCIKGRIPVLLDLELILNMNNEYIISEKGSSFKQKLKKK